MVEREGGERDRERERDVRAVEMRRAEKENREKGMKKDEMRARRKG